MEYKYKSFDDFLRDRHARQYNGLDDQMSDDCEKWICELEPDTIIDYAEKYGVEVRKDILEDLSKWFYKDHNPTENCNCDKCKYYNEIKVVLGITKK